MLRIFLFISFYLCLCYSSLIICVVADIRVKINEVFLFFRIKQHDYFSNFPIILHESCFHCRIFPMLIIQLLIIKSTAKIIKIPPNLKRAWRAVLPNLALYLSVSVLLFCCRRWGIVSIWRSYSNFTYHNKLKLHLLQIPLFLLRQNGQCFS